MDSTVLSGGSTAAASGGAPSGEAGFLADVIETQNAIAGAEMSPAAVMEIISAQTRKLTGADGVVIEMVEGEQLICRAATGITTAALGLACPLENTSSGQTLRSGEPHYVADVAGDGPVMRQRCQEMGIQSMLTVPLSHQGSAVGVLKVVSSQSRAFSREHATALRLMAGLLAAALAHAAAFESKQRLLAERTLAISALQESEERFRAAFENAAIGMAIVSHTGRFLRVNHALCEVLGYEQAELMALNFKSIIHPDDLKLGRELSQRLLEGKATDGRQVMRYLNKQGGTVWALLTAALARGPDERPWYFIAQIQDITQQRQAEEALRASEAEFRAMFDLAGVGKAETDLATGRFIRVNSKFCQIVGYNAEQLRDLTFANLTHPSDQAETVELGERLQHGDVGDYTQEKRYVRRDGGEIWVSVNVAAVRDRPGKPTRAVAIVQDVTERKKAEWMEIDRRRVLEMVARDMPLPEVLAQLSQGVERQIGGWAAVMAIQNGTVIVHGPSLPGDLRAALHQRCVALAAKLSSDVWNADDLCGVTYFAEDDLWDNVRPIATRHGLQSCWAVPIPSNEDSSLGLLAFFSEEKRRPSKVEMQTLDLAGKLATICVEHHNTTGQLAHLVRHDPLTGLPNRLMFEDRLQHALALAKRSGKQAALLFLDIDKFKSINDTLGHQAGDHVLQQFALRLRGRLRESDTMARLGGDEFAVVLPEIDGPEQVETVARKLMEALAEPFYVLNRTCFATTSIGIAMHPDDGQDAVTLERIADEALYRVKQQGRNGFAFHVAECQAPMAG